MTRLQFRFSRWLLGGVVMIAIAVALFISLFEVGRVTVFTVEYRMSWDDDVVNTGISPDGERLVTTTTSGDIVMWDTVGNLLNTATLPSQFLVGDQGIGIRWHADSSYVLLWHMGIGMLIVGRDGQLLQAIDYPEVLDAAWVAGSRHHFYSRERFADDEDYLVRVWSALDATQIDLPFITSYSLQSSVDNWSPDKTHFIADLDDGSALIDTMGTIYQQWTDLKGLQWSPDGRYLAVGLSPADTACQCDAVSVYTADGDLLWEDAVGNDANGRYLRYDHINWNADSSAFWLWLRVDNEPYSTRLYSVEDGLETVQEGGSAQQWHPTEPIFVSLQRTCDDCDHYHVGVYNTSGDLITDLPNSSRYSLIGEFGIGSQYIIIEQEDIESQGHRLMIVDYDGNIVDQLIVERDFFRGQWSPDQRRVVLWRSGDYNSSLSQTIGYVWSVENGLERQFQYVGQYTDVTWAADSSQFITTSSVGFSPVVVDRVLALWDANGAHRTTFHSRQSYSNDPMSASDVLVRSHLRIYHSPNFKRFWFQEDNVWYFYTPQSGATTIRPRWRN